MRSQSWRVRASAATEATRLVYINAFGQDAVLLTDGVTCADVWEGEPMKRKLASAVFAFLALAACSAQPARPVTQPTDPLVADGRAIAERECAGCHALDQATASPRAGAPPMRDMLARYQADALANDLITGIRVGHQDMPEFDFDVRTADALIAYLRSLRAS
jgi:mono/diheme cytochrome c family protein